MSFMYRKIAEHQKKQEVQVRRDFVAGGKSIKAAELVLNKWPNLHEHWFSNCSLKELKIWRQAIQSKRSFHRLLPTIDALIQQREFAATQKSQASQAKKKAAQQFQSFSKLSARELIAEAEEMREEEVRHLLAWERDNKDRASVVKALTQLLSNSDASSRTSPESFSRDFGPNPFQKENEKVYKRRHGTVRERCPSCGEFNSIDVALLEQVLHRRSNSTRGRMEAWADRQIEAGARMTGNHAAAEMSRANQMNIANLVTAGFPCASCGAQLLH